MPYGVRVKMKGRLVVIPFGVKIQVWSLTPSRIGIIASVESNAEPGAAAGACAGAARPPAQGGEGGGAGSGGGRLRRRRAARSREEDEEEAGGAEDGQSHRTAIAFSCA